MSEDPFNQEYYALLDGVRDFDKTLLTIKGWGVTVSLAGLGFGFQNQHYGLFLVAALSAVSFWALEGLTKRHQLDLFLRMREIEVITYETRRQGVQHELRYYSTPQINWTHRLAKDYFTVKTRDEPPPKPERYTKKESEFYVFGIKSPWPFYLAPYVAPRIALPHVIIVLTGSIFFRIYI